VHIDVCFPCIWQKRENISNRINTNWIRYLQNVTIFQLNYCKKWEQ